MECGFSMMRILAAGEVLIVFAGVMAYIWRLQFTFPEFAVILLAFIIATFFVHGDRLQDLGLGSRGLAADPVWNSSTLLYDRPARRIGKVLRLVSASGICVAVVLW
jgi:hypothetical protein